MKRITILALLLSLSATLLAQNKLENQHPVNHENMLTKVKQLELVTWNYHGETNRHYGLTDEQLISIFGLDEIGTIADKNSGFNTDNKIALNFTIIWAMAKTIDNLIEQNNELKSEIYILKDYFKLNSTLQSDIVNIQNEIIKIRELESQISTYLNELNSLKQEVDNLKYR